MAVLLTVGLLGVCLVSDASSDAVHVEIEGEKFVCEVDGTVTYELSAYDGDYDATKSFEYTASLLDGNGSAQSNAVSPSSGTVNNGSNVKIAVTAPSDAGTYTLKIALSVSDDDDSETVYRYAELKVVEPITLGATLNNNSKVELQDFVVYFMVDGVRMEDSRTTVSVAANGSTSISYDWIVAGPSSGKHTFAIVADAEAVGEIKGLGEENPFYVGQSDYSGVTVTLGVFALVLLVLLVYIFRKPVKNYGKPRSRR
ncbi:MAG: hypothetical protein RBQ77_00165 [Candidatus Methanomethylophilaceae archaeon]|jgi:hypothetical protein|nr:hypothetical protein [Candidatus Methanomethylophilaceae archaeon]NLF33438.1 hypothetical protein [Thermoplasmatales archaeon]